MTEETSTPTSTGFSGAQVALIVVAAIIVTAGVSFWIFRTYINPGEFKPVVLSATEQETLNDKLRVLGVNPEDLPAAAKAKTPEKAPEKALEHSAEQLQAEGRLQPEKYEEAAEKRDVRMSERELNSLIASNTDLAKRFAVDLSSDLASAKLLIPVDPHFPFMGGKTLRVSAGLELAYSQDNPVVRLRGVSVMGVPVPNAWLGNLKNVDLVEQFGSDPGFWQAFSAGVNLIQIEDGQLHIQLKE